eukprot:TRINITY_DN19555_c0_g1_i1.p1 TRINITY_DN19555_c0_g1~~TRINITY_DN19555_c0_g1_i1.p1  ORF type:complete len:3849 (+),score=926.41 TRINITY_DN19555_c0_g1_i1:65-11548(+)
MPEQQLQSMNGQQGNNGKLTINNNDEGDVTDDSEAGQHTVAELRSLWRVWSDQKVCKGDRRAASRTVVKALARGGVVFEEAIDAMGGVTKCFDGLAYLLALRVTRLQTDKMASWMDGRRQPARDIICSIAKVATLATKSRTTVSISAMKLTLVSLQYIIRGLSTHGRGLWAAVPSGPPTTPAPGIPCLVTVSGLAYRPAGHSSASGVSPDYQSQPLAHLIFRALRSVLDIPWVIGWDEGVLAEACLKKPESWLPLVEAIPYASTACMVRSGPETATVVRDEWVAAMGSLTRLASISSHTAVLLAPAVPTSSADDALRSDAPQLVGIALHLASTLLEMKHACQASTSDVLLTAAALLEMVLNCVVSCLTFNKVLVTSFEKRMGYTTVSTLLKRLGEGFDGAPHSHITFEQLKQSVHIPLVLLAISGAPMLTANAVEEFVISGSAVLEGLAHESKDPWKKLWGTTSAGKTDSSASLRESLTDSFVYRSVSQFSRDDNGVFSASFSSSSSQFSPQNAESPTMLVAPASYVSLEAASLPWCNGHAFGLLLHAFDGCRVDFRLRKLLLHSLLFALVKFPRQYLKQTDSDACLWYYHPISVISSSYHIDLDVSMQEAFLSCSFGLITYALKRVGDPQRLSVWTHNVLDEALIFDLKCIIQLLHPPTCKNPLTEAQSGCGKWFLGSMERVLSMVAKLHRSKAHGVYKALRRAGLCEAIAKLLKSGFGWGDAPFISNVISILYRQCKNNRGSIRLLLDSCHGFLADLYALMIYLIPETPNTYSHFRVVTQLLYLISCEHDVVGDLITVSEIAPIGCSFTDTVQFLNCIPCPHCIARQPSHVVPAVGAEATPELPTLSVSVETCCHRQHPHIEVNEAPEVKTVPDCPLKKAALRRKIMLTLIKLFDKTNSGAADFRACRGFHRLGDACERDATTAGSLIIDQSKGTTYIGVPDSQSPIEAISTQTNAFEMSESELSDKQEGVDLLWYLQGNLLVYMAVATAASMSAPGTAAMEESKLAAVLGATLKTICPASLPGSKLLLGLGLVRLAVHSTTLPTPDDVASPTLLHHGKIPGSIVVPQLPTDRHHMWSIYHPSALIAALGLARHEADKAWEASSLLQRHILSIIRRVNRVTVHNAVELHQSGLVRELLGTFDVLKERRDDELCKAVFNIIREVGTIQCSVEECKTLLSNATDDYLGEHCLGTFRYWAARDTPPEVGPHHYMSFPNMKDDQSEVQAPIAILPRLACSPWPYPSRGYTMSLWTRFEALDNAMGGAVVVSTFSHDDSGCCMVTDVCLNNTNASVSAALMFRVSMTDDQEETSQVTYYNTTPSGISQLKPGKWYHLVITHYIEQKLKGANHTFDVKVDGGMREGYNGKAHCLIPYDKKDRLKRFAKKGGKLACMVFGTSLNDYLFGKPTDAPPMQKIMALLKADDLDDLIPSTSSPFASFQLGSMMMFWGGLTDWQTHLLYSIGRDYCSDFQESLVNYHCHGILSANVCGSPSTHIRSLASQWLSSAVGMAEGIEPARTEGLQEKLLMVISVRKGAFVASRVVFSPRDKAMGIRRSGGDTPATPSLSVASLTSPRDAASREGSTEHRGASDEEDDDIVIVEPPVLQDPRKPRAPLPANVPVVLANADSKITMFNPVPLTLANGAVCMTNTTLKTSLRALGGVHTAISLISLSKTHHARVSTLHLLADLMKYSPEHSQTMTTEGYSVLSWYLKKSRVTVDEEVLDGCLLLAGVDVENLESSFLQDITAARLVILDWGIWCRGSVEVQKKLLNTLTKLVVSHKLSKAHRTMLIHAGAFQWLLRLTHSESAYPDNRMFSPTLRPDVLDLLSALSGVEWGAASPCHASLNLLVKHFVATSMETKPGCPDDKTWRRALLSMWVVFLSRCGEKEMATLVTEHGVDTFIALLGESCSESRLLILLGICIMMKHPVPRTAFTSAGLELLLHQYCRLQKNVVAPSDHTLDTMGASVPEIGLMLMLLVRGVAHSRKGSDEVGVQQPLLALVFLKSYGPLLAGDLSSSEVAILSRTASEVLAACGPHPSHTAELHAKPSECLYTYDQDPPDARSLKETAAQLQKLITDGVLPSQIMGSGGSSTTQNSNSGSNSPPVRPKFNDLPFPEMLPTLLIMTMHSFIPGPASTPLAAANIRFKKSMIADALRQVFVCGSNNVKHKFIERQMPSLVATLQLPRFSSGDTSFAWLALTLLCDMVAWGVAESPDTSDGSPPYPDLLENSLEALSTLGVGINLDQGTVLQWVHHLQQHLLHAVLLKFRKRLLGAGAQKNAAVVRFVAFAETCLDTMQAWRVVKTQNLSPQSPSSSPEVTNHASNDAFLPISELLEDPSEEVAYEHLDLLVETAHDPAHVHLHALRPSLHTRQRATGHTDMQSDDKFELVWLLPEPVPSQPHERLVAYDWMLSDIATPCDSPVRKTRGRSTAVHLGNAHDQESHDTEARNGHLSPEPQPSYGSRPTTPSDEARTVDSEEELPDLSGAPEDVRSFMFWLFETIHVAVGCAMAMQNNKTAFPLRVKLPRFGAATGEAVLVKQMKRLLIELVSLFTMKLKHPLQPAPDCAITFALVTLLHSVSMNMPLGADSDPPDDIWCSQWWIPVSHGVKQHSLIAVFTSKGDDEPTFAQQLMFHTSPRLRCATGMERFQLRKVWKYLIEVKSSTVKKACVEGALPTDTRKNRNADTTSGECVLFSLLLTAAPSLPSIWAVTPASGAEDRLFTPAFVAKVAKYHDKVAARVVKRHEDKRRLNEGSITGKAHVAHKNKVTKGAAALNNKKVAARISIMGGISQIRSQMKDSRGSVGKLVRSRMLLQGLWGEASAIFTRHRISMNWRLDDVEGPDRMRVKLKRILAVPLVNELNLTEGCQNEKDPSEPKTPREDDDYDDDDEEEDELQALVDHQFEPGMYGPDQDLYKADRPRVSYQCAQVTPMVKVDGELVLFPNAMYYVSNDSPYRDDLERVSDDVEPPPPGSRGHDPQTIRRHEKKKMIHKMHLHAVRHRVTAWYSEVSGVFRRRYLLMNNSLEIFTERGLAFFFSFRTEGVRDEVYHALLAHCPRAKEMSPSAENLKRWRDRWVQGKISNFQYLMSLNTLAGRSFNDVTQYPVFPYVVADYTSEELDLNNPNSYRDLMRPMGCQTEERRQKAAHKYAETLEMYEMMKVDTPSGKKAKQSSGILRLPGWGSKSKEQADSNEMDLYTLPPYHHGSHFSNRATVLYYCIRLQPFTDYFCELNDLKLDVPDRCFHSVNHAWKLSSEISTTDVKELTPEFFYLPDFLVNSNRIKLGVKQDKHLVNHVELPPWARGDPRRFVQMQRKALEGEYCSKNLHHWIDLMFGYKASRESPAMEALNCFHPYAYEGAVNIDSITDDIKKQSTIDIINNFGQMPQQLLTKPHPKRMVERIFGVRDTSWWQVGRPLRKISEADFGRLQEHALVIAKTEMRKGYIKSLRIEGDAKESATTRGIDSVAEEDADDEVYSVQQNRILLVHSSFEAGGEGNTIGMVKAPTECLRYMNWDNSVKIHLYDEGARQGKEVLALRHSCRPDTVLTAATSVTDAAHIALGTDSGVVEVYRYGLSAATTKQRQPAHEDWSIGFDHSPTGFRFTPELGSGEAPLLPGSTLKVQDSSEGRQRTLRPLASLHGHTLGVVAVVISKEFNVLLSGGRDGLVIIWDLLELTFVRGMSALRGTPRHDADSWESQTQTAPRRGEVMAHIDINPLNGDIVAISHEKVTANRTTCQLNLWNINGVELARRVLDDLPTCLQFTGNMLAVGCQSGKIHLFSAVDLTILCPSLHPRPDTSVTAIATNEAHTKLYTAHQSYASSANQSMLATWMVAKDR